MKTETNKERYQFSMLPRSNPSPLHWLDLVVQGRISDVKFLSVLDFSVTTSVFYKFSYSFTPNKFLFSTSKLDKTDVSIFDIVLYQLCFCLSLSYLSE